jgi:hypothetical protein
VIVAARPIRTAACEAARCSGGRAPEQFVDTAAFALGRPARTSVASGHRDRLLARRRGRTVVGVALGGHRCAGPLGDHPHDDHDTFASVLAEPHLITGPDRMRGLDPHPVDPDVPGPAGTGRGRAGPGQPHRPDPAVHPSRLITGHSATVMRCAGLEPTAGSSLRPAPLIQAGWIGRHPGHHDHDRSAVAADQCCSRCGTRSMGRSSGKSSRAPSTVTTRVAPGMVSRSQ